MGVKSYRHNRVVNERFKLSLLAAAIATLSTGTAVAQVVEPAAAPVEAAPADAAPAPAAEAAAPEADAAVAEDSGIRGIEEIVVTARKREEAIQDIPVAVTAVTAETLESNNITNFQQATALTPGFSASVSTVSPQALTLAMRGSAQNDVLISVDPSVGVYVDGVYIARAYGVGADLVDLKNVQVLKGPQGTLFGRNSTAGAVLLQTNDPELGVQTGYGSVTGGQDVERATGVLNVAAGDKWAFRVAHQRVTREDYVTNQANDPNNSYYRNDPATGQPYTGGAAYTRAKTYDTQIGGYENTTTRLKLRYAPTDALDMVLSHEEYESDLAGPVRDQVWFAGQTIPQNKEDDTISLSFDPRAYAQTRTTSFTANYQVGDIGDLKFIASTRDYKSLLEGDYDGGDLAAPPLMVAANTFSARRHGSWGRTGGDQDSYELQFTTALFDDRLDLVSGVTYFKESATQYDYSYGTNPYMAANTSAINAGGNWLHLDTKSLGIYTQGTFHINDASNVTVGLRATQDDKSAFIYGNSSTTVIPGLPSWDFETYRQSLRQRGAGGALVPVPESAQFRPQKDFSSTDWLLSYDYKFNDDMMAYAKVSTGFRAGGFNGRGVSLGLPIDFEPEELTEYEIGFKAEFFDRRLRWNTAVYTNTTEGKQFSVLSSTGELNAPPGTTIRNAGESEAKGFETEFTVLLGDDWTLSGSYAFIDAEITSLKALNPNTNQVEEVGDDFRPHVLLTPENQWTLSLSYAHDFSFMNVSANALYSWIDEMEFGSQPIGEIYSPTTSTIDRNEALSWVDAATSDAYGLLHLNLTLSPLDDRYAVSFWTRNALDERATQSSIGFISGGAYQYATSTYTEPRTYGVTLRVNF